jgi:hypothetical protein
MGSVMPIRLVLGVLDCRVTDLLHEERRLSRAFDGRWGLKRRRGGSVEIGTVSGCCRAAVTVERINVSCARSRGFARCVARRADLLNEWQKVPALPGDRGGRKARIRPEAPPDFANSLVAGLICLFSPSARTAPR